MVWHECWITFQHSLFNVIGRRIHFVFKAVSPVFGVGYFVKFLNFHNAQCQLLFSLCNYLLLPHITFLKKTKRVGKKYFVLFYCLVDFNCLNPFTSWVIGQYVYCNYLLPSLWHHKCWNWCLLFCYMTKIVKTKI